VPERSRAAVGVSNFACWPPADVPVPSTSSHRRRLTTSLVVAVVAYNAGTMNNELAGHGDQKSALEILNQGPQTPGFRPVRCRPCACLDDFLRY